MRRGILDTAFLAQILPRGYHNCFPKIIYNSLTVLLLTKIINEQEGKVSVCGLNSVLFQQLGKAVRSGAEPQAAHADVSEPPSAFLGHH